jgi:undecaprenyl-diphosphatase
MLRRFLNLLVDQWRSERWFIVIAFVFATCGYVFLEISSEVHDGETQSIDNAILRALRTPDDVQVPIGPHWLLHAAQDISALGGTAVISLITLTVLGYFIISRRFHAAGFLSVSVLGATIAIIVLKGFFGRPRPSIVPHLVEVTQASFPSGHALISAMFYLTLGAMLARATTCKSLKLYAISVAILLTLLIGLTRCYLGVHYPSDVLAGWCVGTAWATGTYLMTFVVQRLQGKQQSKPGAAEVPLDEETAA